MRGEIEHLRTLVLTFFNVVTVVLMVLIIVIRDHICAAVHEEDEDHRHEEKDADRRSTGEVHFVDGSGAHDTLSLGLLLALLLLLFSDLLRFDLLHSVSYDDYSYNPLNQE